MPLTGLQGLAGRLELRHESPRLIARAFAMTADTGFSNPSAGIAPGRQEAGARVTASLFARVKLIGEAIQSRDLVTGGRRTGGLLAVETKLTRALAFEFGMRRASETAQAALGTSAGVLPFGMTAQDGFGLTATGEAIDPVSGLPLNRPGFSPQLTAGANAAPTGPVDETTLRARVTVTPTARVNLYAEAEQDVRDAAKRMAAVGAQVQVTEQNRAYVRHDFLSSLDGPYGLTATQRRFDTLFGFASAVRKDGDVFSEYRVRDGISGREAEAAIGLRNQWTLADGVRASAGFERLQVVQGQTRQASAVSGGLEYTRSQWLKGTGRLEWRTEPGTDTWLATAGLAQRLSSNWSLLAKDYYQLVLPVSGPRQTQHRLSVGGAYRSTDSNRLNLLTRYELRVEDAPGADGLAINRRVQAVSTHVDSQLARGWTLSGQHAAKWVDDRTDGTRTLYRVNLVSGRMGYDLFSAPRHRRAGESDVESPAGSSRIARRRSGRTDSPQSLAVVRQQRDRVQRPRHGVGQLHRAGALHAPATQIRLTIRRCPACQVPAPLLCRHPPVFAGHPPHFTVRRPPAFSSPSSVQRAGFPAT